MPIITSKKAEPQASNVIPFPRPLWHKTRPCPDRPGGGLWRHGEQVPGTDRIYCARCDVFFRADHFCFVERRR